MKKISFKSKNGQNITISAVINFPQAFEESEKYPAIVVAHPGGRSEGANGGSLCSKTGGERVCHHCF
jgi:uncharacterized protein